MSSQNFPENQTGNTNTKMQRCYMCKEYVSEYDILVWENDEGNAVVAYTCTKPWIFAPPCTEKCKIIFKKRGPLNYKLKHVYDSKSGFIE